MAMNFGSDRVVRQLMALKLGYLKPLNIIHARNSMSGGSTHLPWPISRLSVPNHSRHSVIEAMTPAAAGIGKPRNSLFAASELAAARQLKRASRKAPQMRYTEAI